MHVILDFTIVPIGVGVSLSPYIAACERILADSGLTYELHANGTNVEGEWEDAFAAIRRATRNCMSWVCRVSTLRSNLARA